MKSKPFNIVKIPAEGEIGKLWKKDKKSFLYPIVLRNNPNFVLIHFIAIGGENRSFQEIKLLTSNKKFQERVEKIKQNIKLDKYVFRPSLNFLGESEKTLSLLYGHLLTGKLLPKLYDTASFEKNEELTKQLEKYAKNICKEFDISDRYLITIKQYILTGNMNYPTGIVAKLDNSNNKIELTIDEGVGIREIKEHWKYIAGLQVMLPSQANQKTFRWLDDYTDIYNMHKQGVTYREILKKYPQYLTEDTLSKIFFRMKERTRDK